MDLLKDEYDIIISGLSLTPQRALLINFSEPYSHSSSVLIANKKLAGRLPLINEQGTGLFVNLINRK
ncbi:MAG: transporter substrate-binding domain-containing protein [Deltaproteobacteria bacterium]|nr:transporter substrate-binding domain-containing protein [Deltaproteobacteria bacterium]